MKRKRDTQYTVPASALTLTPDPANPNRMAAEDKARMAASLAEFGDLSGVLLNRRTGLLIGGHQRVDVLAGADVHVVDLDAPEPDGTVGRGYIIHGGRKYALRVVDWPPERAHAALLAANRFGRVGQDDAALLKDLLQELDSGATDMDLTGYTAEAIEQLMTQVHQEDDADAEPQVDQADQLCAEWGVQMGQLWAIGDHRLLVGDSTDSNAVADLTAGTALQIMDPPFDKDYSAWGLVKSASVVMVWQRGDQAIKWEASALIPAGYGCHELVFVGGVRGWPCDWFPCTIHDVVRMWRNDRAAKQFDKAALKGSECRTIEDGTRPFSVQEHAGGVLTGYGGMSWGKALVAMEIAMSYIGRGEVVYDPCAGSGTSLVAAEKHGRLWRGVETQPRWAALILQRMSDGFPALDIRKISC